MKKVFLLVLALAMMTALLTPAAFADDKTFVMGIDPEYPPFSYLGDDGNYTGFDVEVCKAVCDYLGWKLDIFGVNWDEKLVQLDSMKEAGYVISEPYYDNTQVLVVKADSGFKSSKDLAGKIVAVQLGTSGESLLNGDLADLAKTFDSVLTCDSFLKCFTELQGGAVDAVFVDMPVAASYVAKNEGLSIIDENLGAEQYGIAFRSGDSELCKTVDDAVQALVENGTYAKIAEKEEYADIVNNLLFLNK